MDVLGVVIAETLASGTCLIEFIGIHLGVKMRGKAHLEYIGRKGGIDIETRDGEILTSKGDIDDRAAEWSDTLQWRSRPTVSSVSMIFSMPEGSEPDKVLGAVRALAHAELSDNHDYVMALHTDTPRPHVHLTV